MAETTEDLKLLPDFKPSHGFSCTNFDEPYFKGLEEIEAAENETDTSGDQDGKSLMSKLLETESEYGYCRPRAETIESVLAGADVQTLRQEKAENSALSLPVAMVRDWSFTEKRARKSLNSRGSNSSHDLYKSLERKVPTTSPFQVIQNSTDIPTSAL